jgi:DnaJ domain
MRDPYASLEVPQSATADDIKKSFRRLAKRLHPDANNNDPVAATLFAQLKAAHEILGDKEKRRAFDRGEIDGEGKPTRRAIARHSRPSTWHIVTRLMVVIVILAVTSVLVIRGLTSEEKISSDGGEGALIPVAANEEHVPVIPSEQIGARFWSESRLLFPQSVSYVAADTIRLDIQVGGETAGLAVEISGLAAGMTISAGRPQGAGRWRILATDVDNAMIYLPPGFSGAIDFAVELRFLDDTVVDHGSLRLEWLQTAPIESAGATAVSKSSADKTSATAAPRDQDAIQDATGAVAVSQTSADKALAAAAPADQNAMPHVTDSQHHESIALLIGRSERLLSEGEGEAARILLRPAVDAHDARAALALGATYDPIMLAILQARGVPADASLAPDWYKKAKELGSREAQRRLRLLATLTEPKKRVVRPPVHVVVSRLGAPRPAAPPRDPNAVSVARDRVAAVPDPSTRARLSSNDDSEKLRLFGVSY